MTLKQCILVANDCYKKGTKMNGNKPTGIVVHSTGANNKTLKRYVQPSKSDAKYSEIIADIGTNLYNNHWNKSASEMGRSVCVHGFIGTNANGIVETYQTLPFDICCWGVGSGSKGSYNFNPTARVQFEMCEDGLTDAAYFNAVMKEAQEFSAYLCKLYGFGVDKISSHRESHLQGYGGNHGDPENWLSKFGKNMDWFRAEVQKLLNAQIVPTPPITPPVSTAINEGDLVKISNGATYYSGKLVPGWVANQNWYVREISGDRVVIDKNEKGTNAICSPISSKYLTVVKASGNNVPSVPVATIKVGSTVRLQKGAKTYTGGGLASFVYNRNHIVREIKGDRVVITYGGVVVAAVRLSDLKLI